MPEPHSSAPHIQDWARFVSITPRMYYRPPTVAELGHFLEAAGRGTIGAGPLRVLGGLHSCSDICVADTILDVSDLPRTMDFDPGNGAVTVTTNWSLHDFLAGIAARGKSLTATGGADAQSLAGLISTNTAPATMRASLYDLLEWIEYLRLDPATGAVQERRIPRDDPDFPAAMCSLGAIGLITKVRFRLVDQLFFRTVQKVVDLDEVLDNVEATSATYDFWRVNWLQDSNRGLLWAATAVPPAQADPNGDYKPDQAEGILKFLVTHLDKIKDVGPLLDPILEGIFDVLAAFHGTVEASGPLRNMLPVDRRAPLHVAMAEWSFDPAQLKAVLAACRAYFKANRWPNLPTEIELTRTDRNFMSPWNWPDLPYVVKFNFQYMTDVCTKPGELAAIPAHLRGLWAHLLGAGIRFKAHWGKLNFMDRGFVQAHYRLDQFEPHIQPLFVNRYLRERLLA